MEAITYVPEKLQGLPAAMEGHLLTVHCDCQEWQVQVTEMSGGSVLPSVNASPSQTLGQLLDQLRHELDAQGYTFQKRFMFPSGQFLNEWKDKELLGDVMPHAGGPQGQMQSEPEPEHFV